MKASNSIPPRWAALGAAAILLLAPPCRADSPALITPGSNPQAFGGNLGWSFQVGATSLYLTHLGILDLGDDGLAEAHPIGLWQGSTPIDSDLLPAGTGAPLSNGFRYFALDPWVTLDAGQSYSIVAFYPSGADQANFVPSFPSGQPQTAPEITLQGNLFDGSAASLGLPSGSASSVNAIVGPSFLFTPVPEPSAIALLALGCAGVLLWTRSSRARQ